MPMVIYTIFASLQDYAFWSCTSKYSCWRQTLTDVRHLPFSPPSTKIPFRTLRRVARRLKEVLVTQSCPTLCDPMDCSPPGSSVHGILQARILEWVAIPFARGSCWSRDQNQISCIAGRFFIIWATREVPEGYLVKLGWVSYPGPNVLLLNFHCLTSGLELRLWAAQGHPGLFKGQEHHFTFHCPKRNTSMERCHGQQPSWDHCEFQS